MEQKKYDLEDRLVEFTCSMIAIVEALPDNRAGNYLAGQLMKCGFSPALNYGEAQSAESRNDFIHKMAVILKELKECRASLKIIRKKEMIKPAAKLETMFAETEHLVAIVGKSISTAKKNRKKPVAEIEN
jgi:four helix bundle protein